jgi:hypothetical protein
MAGPRPQIIASVVLAYLQEVEKRGLLERVRADAGPDLRQVLAKRPLAVTWLDAAAMEQLAETVLKQAGEKALSAISLDAMKRSVGPLFGTVARTSIAILGATPHGLFRRYSDGTGLSVRGFSFAYDRASETSGTMRIEAVAPLSPAYWVTWDGPLAWICDACKTVGAVRRERLAGASTVAKFGIEWRAQ